jgi:pimeloyl-ACP methyl ester carboxylesterase
MIHGIAKLPNQVELPYVEQGDPTGVALLLVHAIADSWRTFERLLAHLPPSIHALALTQRGHSGASRPATGYRSSDFATDLEAFMDALEIRAAVIAGGSSGGLVAQRFALDHPVRTLGLVLLGSPLTLRGKPGMQELWDSTVSRLTDPLDPEMVREFARSTLARPVPAAFVEMMVQENLRVPAFVWKATLEGLMQDDFTLELHQIKAPTLILWGGRDTILPRSDQERLAAAIPGARLVVYPGAGHVFYWEEPEHTASDLAAFAQRLGG